MNTQRNLSAIASGARSALALDRAAESEALASFRFLFLAEAAAPLADLRSGLRDAGAEEKLFKSPRAFFNKALTDGDAQTLCVVNIDDFGGLGPLYERLRRFRETAPYVPIVLLSFGFRSDDFTSTRLPVCDVSMKLPRNRGALSQMLSEAIANNHLWCARHRLRDLDGTAPLAPFGNRTGAVISPGASECDAHSRSIGSGCRIFYGFGQGGGEGLRNLMPALFLGAPKDAESSAFAYWLRTRGLNLFSFASPEMAIGQALAAPKSWSLMVVGPRFDHAVLEEGFSSFGMIDRPAVLLLSERDPCGTGKGHLWDAWLPPSADATEFEITLINTLQYRRQTRSTACSPGRLSDLNTTLRRVG
ncbi:hypothetical protein [Alkalilacustris brevis]|uniref:hypothetical protein n=1 Tax=Alkalilacustris brevis TaxID=2026338 RepID=UPI0012D2A20F|nr:hypothetical protein [Alkalilacustris brevis]